MPPSDETAPGGSPAPQTTLKALLKEKHLHSYRRFTKFYREAARKLDKGLVDAPPSEATYKRWLTGRVKNLPREEHCAILEAMFPGWKTADLLSPFTAPNHPPLDGHQTTTSAEDPRIPPDNISRPLIKLDPTDQASPAAGYSDVHILVDAHRHYEIMYRNSGGLPAKILLERFLREHANPILASSYREHTGRQLLRAMGSLVALTGICCYDCEHYGAAQRHFEHAQRLADAAGDLRFGSYVYALMVNQALALRDFRQAIDFTEAAVHYASNHMSPALTADLRAMQAKAYAQIDEPKSTYLAITQAESSATRIHLEEEPPETGYVQPGLIEAKLGEALSGVGDLNPAYEYAQKSLTIADHPRGRVNRLASMVDLELQGGDVEHASSLTVEMVELATGMESRRLNSRFRELRTKLNSRRTSLTHEAVERLDRTLRIFP
ncbi:transcriptional regulator [Actinosynnema sp. ALI-1.44]|uniref:transcriptional regulator n=1 Tax=Actinosynnema sp. ALI-1.44 TaxID=1933779 RepID=UPI00117864FE|nr:transcriptional regulator [Actinosynnema sp. ALI-1.44]